MANEEEVKSGSLSLSLEMYDTYQILINTLTVVVVVVVVMMFNFTFLFILNIIIIITVWLTDSVQRFLIETGWLSPVSLDHFMRCENKIIIMSNRG